MSSDQTRQTQDAHGTPGTSGTPGSAGSAGSAVSVSTHILDTSLGCPAADVDVQLSVRSGPDALWAGHVLSRTDDDGRCGDLPPLPEGTTHARLVFEVEPYLTRERGSGFFPEVAVTFAVTPGQHYHVPLLLNPYGYSVYRGS